MLAGVAVILLAWLGWNWWPNDQQAIRQLMTQLAGAASVNRADSGFARLAYADRLASFFTTNVTLHLEGIAPELQTISGRAELVQAAMAIRLSLQEADFKIADLAVSFPGEKRTAKAYVVITGHINQDSKPFGQAFRMALRKVNARWLIAEVKTVEHLH